MHATRNKMIVAIAATALILGGATAVYATNGDDGDAPATGPEANRARTAALALLEGGTANSVERDDEDGATWEVEVTKAGGGTVDVRLDEAYQVVVIEGDTEEPGER